MLWPTYRAETCSCILYIATNCNIVVFMTVCIYRYIHNAALCYGLHTGTKHVVVYYTLLLIVILLCSWLYVYIDIYTLQLCVTDLTQRGWHNLRFSNGCLIAVAVWSCTKTWKMMLSPYLQDHAIKAHRWEEVTFHGFFTSALDGGQWTASSPSQLTQNIMYNDDVSTGMFKHRKKAFHLLSTCLRHICLHFNGSYSHQVQASSLSFREFWFSSYNKLC